MRRFLAPLIAALITALFISSMSTAQPTPGFSKTAPIAGTGSNGSPVRITPCANGEIYISNGTSWSCTAAGAGDILGVTAGSGIAGGGTSGTVTVTLDLDEEDCVAGEFFDRNTATGTFTCEAEVGDISSVGATANMGLTGGATSGAATLGLRSTCANGEVLVSGSSGTTWTCGVPAGTVTVGTDLTGTGSAGSPLNLSGAVTIAGDAGGYGLTMSNGQVGYAGGAHGIYSGISSTLNATAAARSSVGLYSAASSTRSAGANDVTNYGAYFHASGGQVNYALYTEGGDVVLNGTGGTTLIKGVTNFDSAVTMDSTLAVQGYVTSESYVQAKDDVRAEDHFVNYGTTPSLSCVGTGETIVGADSAFQVTLGDTSGTCTVTFAKTFTNKPTCTIMLEDIGSAGWQPDNMVPTATTFAFSGASGHTYHVLCTGRT